MSCVTQAKQTFLGHVKSTYMKQICLIGLFTLFWSLAMAQERQLVSLDYEQFRLSNGLTVVLQRDTRVPMIAMQVWYNTGSASEPSGSHGFAHLLEHLMFEGTPHQEPGEFDRLVESAGGVSNALTSYDHTYYYTYLPSNALDLMLYLESDRMGYLGEAITAEKLDRQREVVKNEYYYNYESKPGGKKAILMSGLLFPEGHPYHHPVIGNFDDLDAAQPADITAFFKRFYHPGNASLTIVGDFDLAYARSRIEYWFGGLKGGALSSKIPTPATQITEPSYAVLEDNVEAAQLVLQYPTLPVFAEGDAAMDVLAQLLGKGRSALLYRKLVTELQLAYDLRVKHQSHELSSYFEISATARPGVALKTILGVIDAELSGIKGQAPEEDALIRAVNQIELNWLKNMQSFDRQAFNLSYYYWKKGDPAFINEDFNRYTSLKVADLSRAAREFLRTDRRAVLSIVPKGQSELGIESNPDPARKK